MDRRQSLYMVSDTASSQKLNLTIPLFIFVAILSVYILQYSIYLIHNNFIDKAIKIITMVLLLFFIRKYRLSREAINILFRYGVLFGSAFVGAVMTLDIIGILQLSKIVYMFLVFPLILLVVPPKGKPPDMLLKIPLFFGVLFSLQSIIFFLINFFGVPIEPTMIEMGTRDGAMVPSYGILGYGSEIATEITRVSGWFPEPSLLAAFLLYPTLVSFGYYKSNKKKYYLLISFLCLICMIMTLSLAAFFSLLASAAFLLCVRPVYKRNGNNKVGLAKIILPLIAIIGFLFVAQFVMSKLNDLNDMAKYSQDPYIKLLARDPKGQSGNLFRENYKQEDYISLLKRNPLGVGLGHTLGENEFTSANAPIFWAVSGGVPALVALLILYWKLFFSYCLPLLRSSYSPYRFIGAAFVGATVHGLSYGNWVYTNYLYIVAVTILCAVREKTLSVNIKEISLLPNSLDSKGEKAMKNLRDKNLIEANKVE